MILCVSHCLTASSCAPHGQHSLSLTRPLQELEAAAERAGAAAAPEDEGGAQPQAELHELRAEYDELTVCLGQESAKARPRARLCPHIHRGSICVHHCGHARA